MDSPHFLAFGSYSSMAASPARAMVRYMTCSTSPVSPSRSILPSPVKAKKVLLSVLQNIKNTPLPLAQEKTNHQEANNSPKPKILSASPSHPRTMATHSARHSSYELAVVLKTDPHVCPGPYHVSTLRPVTGLCGGFSMSKLNFPGEVSCNSLPVPWPRSSCSPTWISKAASRCRR